MTTERTKCGAARPTKAIRPVWATAAPVASASRANEDAGDEPPAWLDEEIPLPDLLQLFGTSKKNGVLVIRTETLTGRIFLDQGLVAHAVLDGMPQLSAAKAAYRMLAWQSGVFELEPPAAEQPERRDAHAVAHEVGDDGHLPAGQPRR